MKLIVIREFGNYTTTDALCFDMEKLNIKNCIGCWTCWWKSPGICIHNDLEDFYRGYVGADKAIFYAKLQEGFISSKMKSLFDRMIPLFLPYTSFRDGGTFHAPRYPQYPNIEFYYDYDFKNEEDLKIFSDYIYKVFKQFYSPEIKVLHISESEKGETE
ncbi:hypothetical protein EDD76_1223 [Kineothrix alysoides]|uniref:NADPH-dependent FMN reductase n=1 Tax=Kineothrix alysoides TaxID=1469948 RepID=A0A4R1QLM2_9FIRM|nr:hypothetical protein [Kineothrix alysoides]TCL54087.1 hypothetical protein EDD76_1223 [Kineothrix alysoides]